MLCLRHALEASKLDSQTVASDASAGEIPRYLLRRLNYEHQIALRKGLQPNLKATRVLLDGRVLSETCGGK